MRERIPKHSSTLVELLRWRAFHQPERPAYTFLTDEEQREVHLTYGDLDRRAQAIAALLQSRGTTGERALLLHPPGLDYIVALFGCLYAKVIAVPAYPPHPARIERTLPRLQAIAKDAGATLALATKHTFSSMEFLTSGRQGGIAQAEGLASLPWIATDDIKEGLEDEWKEPSITSKTLAYLQYTSGSTGMPKGVMISHRNVLHNSAVLHEGWQIPPHGEMVSWLPMHHDLGLVGGVLNPFCNGYHSTLMSPSSFLKWPLRWLQVISRAKDRPTISCAPNFAYDLCTRKVTSDGKKENLDLSNWCVAVNGAEPVRMETLERFTKTFEPCGFRWEAFWPGYGLAEATLCVSGGGNTEPPITHPVNKAALANDRVVGAGLDDEGTCTLVGCGHALLDQTIAIVDPISLTSCSSDQIGEIWVSGPSVACGYWNRAQETKSTFQVHLAGTVEGHFLRTGDLGFLANGELFITGRLKDVIIVRGGNYYPQDIERTVEESHKALRPGSVAALSVDIEGEERLVVVQEVSPRKDVDLDAVTGAIRQAVVQMHELQVYAVVLIKPRTIPKTSSGKIQRRACQQAFTEGHLNVVKEWRARLPQERRTEETLSNDTENSRDASDRDELTQSPNSGIVETWLVSHLAEMLGINRGEIDRGQPFASFGLDSAQTVSLIGELEAWLSRSLSATLAWEFPTIKALAEHLTGEATAPVYALDTARNPDSEPIAIIGLGCRFPMAEDPQAFWRLLRDGVDAITEVPTERWDANAFSHSNPATPGKMNTRWGGFLEQVDRFDPHFFGISPREAVSMDPQQRLVLEVSWEALENAGQAPEKLVGSRTGVFIGISTDDYSRRQFGAPGAIDPYAATGNALSIAANRVSYLFDLRGPSLAVDTACSSSLVAVHYACQSLQNGECSLALAGGVNLMLSPELTITFSQARMLAFDGRCKTFDAGADGYVRGEGCGIVVLKRFSDALRAGDTVMGLVRGSAVNQDGRSNGLTAPNGAAQQAVIHQALKNAAVSPDQVCYVEAHGTGTPLGDPVEVRALAAVLGEGRAPDQPCVLGSVKTNIGHLEAAAGIAGLIKVVLLLQNAEIPPHLHLQKINPHLALKNSPFVIATERSSLPRGTKPRFVGVSSFGFGGTNAHVVLEEAPISELAPVEVERSLHLLTLSGKTEEALKQVAVRYADRLADPSVALADFCFSANTGRAHFNHRLSVVAGSVARAREKLETFIAGQEPTGVFKGQVLSTNKPKLAFLFTGQGSQYIGMGRQLYETQPNFRQALDRCDEILRPSLGRSLVEVLYPKSGKTPLLDETAYTQPALFALEYALAQLWRSWGIEPSVVMGHSVGEYVAACVAGVFSLEDGLKLIAERGRLTQNLPEEGEMVVLMAEEARVQAALRPSLAEVAIAAVNGPQNVVISGRRAAVRAVAGMLEREGIKTRPLNVSHAFHSPLIEPMQAEFAQVAHTITYAAPKLLLVSNVTGRLETKEVANPAYWVRHVCAAVRFADGVATLHEQGAGVFVEIGPKPTLLGMAQPCLNPLASDRAAEDRPAMLPSLRPGRPDWQQILDSLSALYVRGVNVDWAGFDKAYTRRKVVLPTYPFQRQRFWVEASKPPPGGAALRPLIDKKMTSPVHKATLFETGFSVAVLPFLADHRVDEAVVVPEACHLALVLSAAELVWGTQGYELADVAFPAVLVVPEEGARTVQLVLTPTQGPYTEFQLVSFAEEDAAATLITHATGRMRAQAAAPPEPVSLDALRQRCGEALATDHIYAAAAQQQLVIGPSFRWLVGLWQGEGELLAELRLPEAVSSLAGYLLHPGLLDACFQVTGISATLLPFAVDALHVYPQATGREWWCHARQISEHRWDIQLVNGLGLVVATVKGFAKQEVSSAAVQSAAVGRKWLYAVNWQPQPQFGLPPDYLPSVAQLHQHGQEGLAAQLPQTTTLERYGAALVRLNTLSIDYVVAALVESGLSFEPGARWQRGQIAEQIEVIAPYGRLLERLLAMLAEAGILQPDGETWTVVRAPARYDPQPLPEPYRTVARAELTLLKRCGAHLGQVLRGLQEPLELLFPGGDASTVSQLYRDSPIAQIMNRLVQRAVQTAIAQLPAGRGLRLLEVGAGTGGTTAGLLPLLPAQQTEYLFTDIGAAFLPQAQAKFAAYDFVAYQTLDIEQPPARQGFALHQYDIVVAANVLHATRDLSETLTHVRQLLAPGGLLVLLEATTRHPWLDLTFGLTDGWWRFADRRTRHPLLSADQWRECLLGSGFQSATFIPYNLVAAPLDQAVIIAQAPATYLAQERSWLLFTDTTGLGAALAGQLRHRGERAILVSAGAAYAQVDDHSFRIHPDHPADYARLATAVGAMQGAVHLWSLDEADEALARPVDGARPGAELEVAARQGCGTALHLVQALLRTQARPPGIWLVTQGAQAVQPAEAVPGVSQSPLWGMGKVIALEHPELQCVCLDLDGHADSAAQAAVLCAELMARVPFAAYEDQVACRNGLRYAARLVRHQGQAAGPVVIRDDATYLITGGLGGLGLRVARWLAEQGARYLLLLGRRQPTPEARRTLDDLSARGTQVKVVQADVTDRTQVSGALAKIDPAHPLCGIIHAAGVLDDGALVQQTWERFAKVLAPKIEGAWNLHRLTQGMTLDLFVMFSSVAALLGNRGQANHAAANTFLDALAYYRRAQHLPALSINWGQWAGTGRAAGLDDRYRARLVAQGLNPIAPEQGLHVLGEVLGQAYAQIGVLPINWSAFREQFPAGMPLPLLSELAPKARSHEEVTEVSEQQHKLLQRLERATGSDRQELLVPYVQERVTEILGLDSSVRPALRQPLNELGFDSLMITQLKNRFMSELGVDVPIKEFIGASIAQLVGLLLDHLALSSVVLPSSDICEDMEEVVL